jgi:hypothetical protein
MEMLKNILLGFLLIGIGIWFVWDTYKNDEDHRGKVLYFQHWKGYIIGGGLILGGVAELFGYLKW